MTLTIGIAFARDRRLAYLGTLIMASVGIIRYGYTRCPEFERSSKTSSETGRFTSADLPPVIDVTIYCLIASQALTAQDSVRRCEGGVVLNFQGKTHNGNGYGQVV